jgi:ketosteroid isomerase-like protein
MSQAGLEAIKKLYERWGAGDIRASVELLDQYAVLVHEPEFEAAGPAYGIDAIVSFTRGMLDAWQRFTIEAEEYLVAGDTVIVRVCQRGVGAGSGVETELHYFMAWTFRGSRVVRMETFRDRARALEVAGLS